MHTIPNRPPTIELPTGLDYPPAVLKAAKAQDDALNVWLNAETAYIEAIDAIAQSDIADTELLRKAVREGTGDPGTPNHDQAERQAAWAQEVERQARPPVDKAAEHLDIALREHTDWLVQAALTSARKGLEKYENDVTRIREGFDQAARDIVTAAEPLALVAPFVANIARYTVDIPRPDIDVRGTRGVRERLTTILANLELVQRVRGQNQRFTPGVLQRYPTCAFCATAPSTIAKYYPLSREDVIANGADPEDPKHGIGACRSCDKAQHAEAQQ